MKKETDLLLPQIPASSGKRHPGSAKGKIVMTQNFMEPLPENLQELRNWILLLDKRSRVIGYQL